MARLALLRLFRLLVISIPVWLVPCILGQQATNLIRTLRTSNAKYASDRILVKFRSGIGASARAAAHAALGASTLNSL
jgi:hypothetical protein